MAFTLNPFTGKFDATGLDTTTADARYLKLDQTTPQTTVGAFEFPRIVVGEDYNLHTIDGAVISAYYSAAGALGDSYVLKCSGYIGVNDYDSVYGIFVQPQLQSVDVNKSNLNYIGNSLSIRLLTYSNYNLSFEKVSSYEANSIFDYGFGSGKINVDAYYGFKNSPIGNATSLNPITNAYAFYDDGGLNAYATNAWGIYTLSTKNYFGGTIQSAVTTGTAPLIIASTTLNDNLNADLWDGYQFSDYLDQAVKVASTPSFASLNIAPTTELYFNDITLINFGADSDTVAYSGTPFRIYWSNGDIGNGRLMFDDGTATRLTLDANIVGTTGLFGNLSLGSGSITDSSGAISFGNENLTQTADTGTEKAPALTTGNWNLGTGWVYTTSPNTLTKNAAGTTTTVPSAATWVVAGTTYKVVITVTITAGQMQIEIGNTSSQYISSTGTYTYYITSTTTSKFTIRPTTTDLRCVVTALSVIPLTNATADNTIEGNLIARSPATFSDGFELNGPITQNGHALLHTTGFNNIFLGGSTYPAGNYILSGYNNVGIGRSMINMTTGYSNVAIGANAMYNSTQAYSNLCFGAGAGFGIGTSSAANSNVAIGTDSMGGGQAVTGSYNLGIGASTLRALTSGGSNIAIGRAAMDSATTCSRNVAIGYRAFDTNYWDALPYSSNMTVSNIVAIGYQAQVWQANSAVIGGTGTYEFVGLGISTPRVSQAISLNGNSNRTIWMERSLEDEPGNDLTVQAGGPPLNGALVTIDSAPTANGSGYTVGDVLTITTGGGNAKVLVAAYNKVSIIETGSGYSVGTGQATSGGTGSGLTVNVTAVAASTNRAGGDLILSSGVSTGSGTSDIYLKTCPAGASGTTERTPTTVLKIDSAGVIHSDSVAPADLHFQCGADKTLVLDETVYNDANVGALILQTGGTLPGIVEWLDNDGDATGIYTRGFAVNEQGSGSIEIPHDYKEGTDLTFHVHFGINDAPSGTDYAEWTLIYNVQRDGTTFVDATTIDTGDITIDTQYKTLRGDFAAITGTNFKIGDQFNFTIKRTAAAGDAFAGELLVQTLGFHYECDTLGSRQIGTK